VSAPPNLGCEPADLAVAWKDRDESAAALIEDTPTVELWADRQALAPLDESDSELGPGYALCGRYVLEQVIGRGGTSIIFRARDLQQASSSDGAAGLVAIKLLRDELRADPSAHARVQREFRQMQRLSHPGIVRVLDLACDGNVWFISMDLVVGRTVKSWEQTPGSLAQALSIISGCCEALEHAHSMGVVHGDLKPTNVMVANDGTVKLIDFGSAPSPGRDAATGAEAAVTGTPLYASPQILAGKVAEPRDDIFSLACLSYSILSAGRHPFGGRPSLEDGRMKSAPTYVRAIPTGLFEVIARALSADREERPASARQFLRELSDAGRVSRATLPILFNRSRWGARGSMATHVSANAPATLAMIAGVLGGRRGSDRGAQPFVRLTALVLAISGAAVLLRLDTQRAAIHMAESSGLVASAQAQSEVPAEVRPLLHDSGIISFEAATVHASAAQSLVAISVRRRQAINTRGTFAWRVERGSAYPGVDYAQLKPQVVSFIEGQSIRTLFIPLINAGATWVAQSPRTFTVALEQVAGGPALGRIARVTVAIDPPAILSRTALYQASARP
jgi:hypothetical protein